MTATRGSVRRAFDAFAFAAAALFAIATAAVAFRNSHFALDDFAGFFLAHAEPFWRAALTPIDLHFVPLHRLVNEAVYTLAPFDFGVALAVLFVAHALALVGLYATLQRLRDSPVNPVLLCFYASNVYLGVLFLWWTSGLHRLPYIALAIWTLYHYVGFRTDGSWRSLLFAAACFVGALGFYSKAPLIPVALLGLEICLLPRTPRGELKRNLLAVAGLLVLGAAYLLAGRLLVDSRFGALHLDPGFLLEFEVMSSALLAQGVFGVVAPGGSPAAVVAVAAGWLALAAITIAFRPWNAVVWSTGFAVVALNLGVIGISHRTANFGLTTVWSYRYYFELMHLVVLFSALALHDLPAGPIVSRLGARGLGRRAAAVVAALLLCALFAASFRGFGELLELDRYRIHREAKIFLDNFRRDLEAVRRQPPGEATFVYGLVPERITGKPAAHVRRHSDFVALFGMEGRFDPNASHRYQILDDGRIRRVYRPAKP